MANLQIHLAQLRYVFPLSDRALASSKNRLRYLFETFIFKHVLFVVHPAPRFHRISLRFFVYHKSFPEPLLDSDYHYSPSAKKQHDRVFLQKKS